MVRQHFHIKAGTLYHHPLQITFDCQYMTSMHNEMFITNKVNTDLRK